MKNWIKSTTNRTFVIVLLALIVFNVYASLNENALMLQMSKALMVPLFFSIYFVKNRFVNNIFISFLLLTFVGDLFSIMPKDAYPLKITSASYFCSYAVLILIGLFRIKGFKFKGLITTYLVAVLILNAYFMYSLYGTLALAISDSAELFFITLQIIALLALGFVAFAGYLNHEGRQSIVFLMLSFCFIFAQVLNFVETYYIVYSQFMLLKWVSHLAGFIFFYKYLVEHNRLRKRKIDVERISVSERIVA